MKKVTIAEHITEPSHLDFFFETEDESVLFTYEASFLDKFKLLNKENVYIYRKNNHSSKYLDFEGEISKNRGSIKILWKGYFDESNFVFSRQINIKMGLNKLCCVQV